MRVRCVGVTEGFVPVQGVIFDCDGTLMDTMGLWLEVEDQLAARVGHVFSAPEQDMMRTLTISETGEYLHGELGILGSAQEVVAEINRLAVVSHVPLPPQVRIPCLTPASIIRGSLICSWPLSRLMTFRLPSVSLRYTTVRASCLARTLMPHGCSRMVRIRLQLQCPPAIAPLGCMTAMSQARSRNFRASPM